MFQTIKTFFQTRALILGIVATAALIGFAGFEYFSAKLARLERDAAITEKETAEATLNTVRRDSILKTEALEQARKDDNARQNFITENKVQVERARKTGDGPVAPVLRDALKRMRVRQAEWDATHDGAAP